MNQGFEKFGSEVSGVPILIGHHSRNCNISAESFAMARQGKKEIVKFQFIFISFSKGRNFSNSIKVGEVFQITMVQL